MMKKLCLFLSAAGLPLSLIAQSGVFSQALSNPQVTAFAQDTAGYLWIGTSRGLNRYNGSRYTIYYASGEEGALNNDHILSLLADADGTLWIGTECGLNWLRDGQFHHFNATVFAPALSLSEPDSLHIAYRTKDGRFQMDKKTLEVSLLETSENGGQYTFFGSKEIRFTDRDGGLWTSDGLNGWNYTARNQPFRALTLSDGDERISHLAFDPEGYLWARAGFRLCSFDPSDGRLIFRDEKHSCSSLFQTQRGSLIVLEDGVTVKEYTTHRGLPVAEASVSHQHEIFSILPGREGRIYLSEHTDIVQVQPGGARLAHWPVGKEHPFSYLLPCPGTDRIFIVGLRDGLLEVLPDGSVRPFGEGFQNVSGMLCARDGSFWMGTYNDGLIHYDENARRTERFDAASGIADPSIKSIVQDMEGNIWCSTATHISRYDPWTRTFSALHDNRFRDGKFYDLLGAVRAPDGKLYFGGSGCVTVVDPIAFSPSGRDIPLRIEAVTVNGRNRPSDIRELRLAHDENNLRLRFAGIDFISGALSNYTWRLEGYDNAWHSASSDPEAVYTRLPSGRYTFRARVRILNGEWSPEEIVLPVAVGYAPWASPLALSLYWIAGIGLLLLSLVFLFKFKMQKDRLAISTQQEEMHKQHIDFMTNISHEFRTPLSLIFAPARELEKSGLPGREGELVKLIVRNADHLKVLSEQLLRSGGREGGEDLRLRQNDLASLVRSSASLFGYAARQKDQTLSLDLPDSCIGLFDTEKVSKVLGNLISNAVKYTLEGGHIYVSLAAEKGDAVITVADDGIGIAPDRRDKIFARFDRLGAENTDVAGSGIGLNYAQALARLHKGEIRYEPNGPRGSVFIFSFPIGADAYPGIQVETGPAMAPAPPAFDSGLAPEEAPTLLIAEDTDGLRYFLGDLFQDSCHVMLASDGLEAIDNLKLTPPDIIISDVVMPLKSGYALCAEVKSSEDWSHIPVILLTARADAESSVEGLKAGADAYLPKPFDPAVLKATVESLLRNRRLLQEKVRSLTSYTVPEEASAGEEDPLAGLSAGEKKLLERLHGYLDAHLDSEDWDISSLAAELGLSYSSLYAKVKALTGETPKSYITAYRMNIALALLQKGDLTVSEVGYRVGASSPSSFSREFKKHFGYPPVRVSGKA